MTLTFPLTPLVEVKQALNAWSFRQISEFESLKADVLAGGVRQQQSLQAMWCNIIQILWLVCHMPHQCWNTLLYPCQSYLGEQCMEMWVWLVLEIFQVVLNEMSDLSRVSGHDLTWPDLTSSSMTWKYPVLNFGREPQKDVLPCHIYDLIKIHVLSKNIVQLMT